MNVIYGILLYIALKKLFVEPIELKYWQEQCKKDGLIP